MGCPISPISPICPICPIHVLHGIFQENNMKLRTLIVEDDKYQADAISYILQATDERQMKDAGIDGFEITVVNCAADARKALDRAGRDAAAYDLLLLDLGLPENPGEDEKPEMGIELLKLARDQEAARGIIVISVFTDLERYALLAATDFIGKPYGKEELQARALSAWKAVREKHRHGKISERDLALYANVGIIYRLSSCFSRLVHSAQRETEELRGEMIERFGERQTDALPEPLARRLGTIESLIRRARDEWREIQEPFQITGDAPHGLAIEEEIKRFAEELRPCIAIKLEPPADPADYDMRILSFKDAFRNNSLMIIREILTGGLSETKEAHASTFPEVVVNIKKKSRHGRDFLPRRFQSNSRRPGGTDHQRRDHPSSRRAMVRLGAFGRAARRITRRRAADRRAEGGRQFDHLSSNAGAGCLKFWS